MLCSFSVKNYRGFKDKITLDLTASDYKFNNECVKDGYAHKALIYGYNGVGKSNFGLAVMDIITNLTDKDKAILLDNNYRNVETENKIVEFEYKFKFNESIVLYSYGKTSPESLVYEYLYVNDKCIISYNRITNEPLTIILLGTETLIRDINKIPISVLKYIKSNTALEPSFEADSLNSFFDYVDRMLFFRNLDDRNFAGYITGVHYIFDEIINKNHFQDFVNFLISAEVPSNIDYKIIGDRYNVFFNYDTDNKTKQEIAFYDYCSTGMKTLSVLFYWLQNAIYNDKPPSFIFIDEFDAFYHQRLSEFVVKKIKDINNCQFILTTHDTGVMSNDIMRPDCLFLMYKNKIRSLSNSTRKELRFAHNIEKMYRAGAFDE
ncbi:MAG: ATP-binding protein [Treponema sp.]|nr:ATP-binding protein [Treponema sp.]MCL2237223.1 ATP-binding protein [Treponema sp.]